MKQSNQNPEYTLCMLLQAVCDEEPELRRWRRVRGPSLLPRPRGVLHVLAGAGVAPEAGIRGRPGDEGQPRPQQWGPRPPAPHSVSAESSLFQPGPQSSFWRSRVKVSSLLNRKVNTKFTILEQVVIEPNKTKGYILEY